MTDAPRRRDRYHHGDLRAALLTAAMQVVAERGPAALTVAEVARRAEVSGSAPYRHLRDRQDLLAAIAVHGYGVLHHRLRTATADLRAAEALAVAAAVYVTWTVTERAAFEVITTGGLDPAGRPDVEDAADRTFDVVLDLVRELHPAAPPAEHLRVALSAWAIAHGHAVLLHGGSYAKAAMGTDEVAAAARAAVTRLVVPDRGR